MSPPAHVLLVDDDEDLRGVVIVLLVSEGHCVTEAAHGRAALDALASGPGVDLVILDQQMPVMDGKTFLALKGEGPHRQIPVIVFSSSPPIGLAGLPDVVASVSKDDGMTALLGAMARALPAGSSAETPGGGSHV